MLNICRVLLAFAVSMVGHAIDCKMGMHQLEVWELSAGGFTPTG